MVAEKQSYIRVCVCVVGPAIVSTVISVESHALFNRAAKVPRTDNQRDGRCRR